MRAGIWTVVAALLVGFQVAKPDPVAPDFNTARPIPAVDSVFIEDLTWMEVRDAMRSGKDTVIVATGGIEQNGPYLAANKHNVVLRGTMDALARKMGNALVAPNKIVKKFARFPRQRSVQKHILTAIVDALEILGEQIPVGRGRVQFTQVKPLSEEVANEDSKTRRIDKSRDFPSQNVRAEEFGRVCQLPQTVVRGRSPEKEGQTGRQFVARVLARVPGGTGNPVNIRRRDERR